MITAFTERGAGLLQIRKIVPQKISQHRGAWIVGQRVVIRVEIGRKGGESIAANVPRIFWLKDGRQSRISPENTVVGRNLVTSLEFRYLQSDEGIHQCIFIEQESQGGVYLFAHPVRVQTGKWKCHPLVDTRVKSHLHIICRNIRYL